MAAPTFVAEYETVWNTGTQPKTASVTVNTNDVLVIMAMTENNTTINTPTGGGLTYTLRQSIVINNFASCYVWTAVAGSSQTFTLSIGNGSGSAWWGFNCLRFSGSDGIGASAKTNVATGAPSLALTTTGANSAIVTANADWGAGSGSRTWRTINSITPTSGNGLEKTYFTGTQYTVYGAIWNDVGAAGSKTTGLSAPTGQTYSIISVEVLGSAGVNEGTAAFGMEVTAAATGERISEGVAALSASVALAGTGARDSSGSAGLSVVVALASQGPKSQGSAAFSIEVSAAATSAIDYFGTAAFGMEVAFAATSTGYRSGTAAFDMEIEFAASGAARIFPIRILTAHEILTGNRNTSFYLDLLGPFDEQFARLDGVTDGKLDWVANAVIKGAGQLTVVDVNQEVDWLTVRIRPVMVIEGLPPQPLGVFLASEVPESWGNGRKWSIKLLDKTTILDQDTIHTTYSYPAGTVATDAIVDLIESAGLINHAVTPSVKTLIGDMVWQPGTSKLRIINDLLDLIGYFSLFANFEGQVVGEPYTLPAERPLMYEFVDGPESIYRPDFVRDADIWSIPNRVTLIGVGDGETAALVSTVDNNDANSPYSIANRGRIIGHIETGIEAADQTTLDALARSRLVDLTSPTKSVEISHSPVPGLAVNQAALFRRVPAGIDARHVVSKTSITLKGTALATSSLREVVDL